MPPKVQLKTQKSHLFQPYRALGFVCDGVPFHLKKLGSDPPQYFVTVAIGKAWQVYNTDKLRLTVIGPHGARKVRALASSKDVTFTASGADITIWKRTEELRVLTGHTAQIRKLLVLGDYLLSVCAGNELRVWKWDDAESETGFSCTSIDIPLMAEGADITAIMHPYTYLNKIVLGFADGHMELWNIKTLKKIFSFQPSKWDLGGEAGAVLTVVQSPALDVVAVGLSTGEIVVLNLKMDEMIVTFKQANQAAVTALSFRTDGFSYLVSAGIDGHMSVWNLDKQVLITTIRHAHTGGVSHLAFLPGEPLMVSSGADNALKMWLFDQQDGTPRLFKSREGHSQPPSRINFYGDGTNVLSSGGDRSLRAFNVIRDRQSRELTQGSLIKQSKLRDVSVDLLRLPPISAFAASTSKERRWSNIVSCHTNDTQAHTWSYEAKRLSKHKLRNPNITTSAAVTAVGVSACGNFAIIGMADGRVEKYNLQSGSFRAMYGGKFGTKKKWHGHCKEVTGISADALNQCVMTTSLDKTFKFWNFSKCTLLHTITTDTPINQLVHQPTSDLAAIVTDDLVVGVYDTIRYTLVRQFRGHQHRISDLTFSPDGRWLVTSCMDSGVRVFDLPTGRLVDWFAFGSPVTSLAFSPTSEFLATTHTDSLGIFLWANRSYFTNVYHRAVPNAPVEMDLPMPETFETDAPGSSGKRKLMAADEGRPSKASKEGEDEDEDEEKDLFAMVNVQPVPLSAGDDAAALVTLSDLPKARWHNLVNLELIKQRNKPKEAPKAPVQAPFFLNVTAGLAPTLDTSVFEQEQQDLANASKLLNNRPLHGASSTLAALLEGAAALAAHAEGIKGSQAGQEDKVSAFLRTLGPNAIDAEIRSLGSDLLREELELGHALDFFISTIPSKANFELLQAVLNLFLKVHSETLVKYPILGQKQVDLLRRAQSSVWRQLEKKVQHSLCLVAHLGNTQM